MFRKLLIFSVFICFTFSTFEELVKLCIDTIEIECVDIETEDSEEKYIEKEFDLDKISSTASLNLTLLSNQETSKKNIYNYNLGVAQSYTNRTTPPPELTV